VESIAAPHIFYEYFHQESIDVLKLFGTRRGIYGVNTKHEIVHRLFSLYNNNNIMNMMTDDPFQINTISLDFIALPPHSTIEKWIAEENEPRLTQNENAAEEIECSICYIDIKQSNYRKLKCGHLFCSCCIDTLKSNAAKENKLYIQCPLRCGDVTEIFYHKPAVPEQNQEKENSNE